METILKWGAAIYWRLQLQVPIKLPSIFKRVNSALFCNNIFKENNMKLINKLWLMAAAVFVAAACQKVDVLPVYKNGVAPVMTASTTTFAALAADSLKPAITFSWTSPAYATDSSKVKYMIEIDLAGRNFSKAVINNCDWFA